LKYIFDARSINKQDYNANYRKQQILLLGGLLLQNNTLSIVMLVSAMGSLFLTMYIFQRRKNLAMLNLSLLLMAVTVWALGYSLELASTRLQLMKFFATFAYLGIATIPVFWLIFVARYSGNDSWLTPLNQVLLFVIPFVSIVLVATNDLHHLFYAVTEEGFFGNFSFLNTEPTLFWWVHVVYSYLAILAGLWLLISLYFRVPRANRFLVGLFIAGLLLPYVANFAYISGFKPYGFLDITPIVFIVMGVMLSFGAFTKRALDVTPLAFDLLFKNIPDAIFVIDVNGRIINTNPTAQKLLNL
jgi:PAS domain-containing protein